MNIVKHALEALFFMSTFFTSDSSLREETLQADSYLRKRNDIIFKLRHHIQQKNKEKDTLLFKRSVHKYHKTFETSRKELSKWYIPKKACKAVRKYSSRFKQKVINEVHLGKRKSYVAEKYHISYKTLMDWVDKAFEPIPETKNSPKMKRYPLDFKQKVVSEVRLGKCKSHVAEKYGLCYQTLRDWTKKVYLPFDPIPETKKPSKSKNYPPDFKQKVISEVRLGMCRTHTAEKYNLSYKTLAGWIRQSCLSEPIPEIKEPSEEKKHPLDFKQKVVSEVCSGQHINQVCKNHNIDQSSLHIWLKQAYSPNFPYNSSAAWIDES